MLSVLTRDRWWTSLCSKRERKKWNGYNDRMEERPSALTPICHLGCHPVTEGPCPFLSFKRNTIWIGKARVWLDCDGTNASALRWCRKNFTDFGVECWSLELWSLMPGGIIKCLKCAYILIFFSWVHQQLEYVVTMPPWLSSTFTDDQEHSNLLPVCLVCSGSAQQTVTSARLRCVNLSLPLWTRTSPNIYSSSCSCLITLSVKLPYVEQVEWYLLFRSIRKSAESIIRSYSLYQWTCKVGVARMRHSNTTNWPLAALMFWSA